MDQRRSLIFQYTDQNIEVNKLFIIWLTVFFPVVVAILYLKTSIVFWFIITSLIVKSLIFSHAVQIIKVSKF